MSKVIRDRLFRLTIAALIVFIALLLMLWLDPWITMTQSPFLLFFGAIIISAWYRDQETAIFATLLSAACANYFFQEPKFQFTLALIHSIRLLVFIIQGLVVSLLLGNLRTAQEHQRKSLELLKVSEAKFRRLVDSNITGVVSATIHGEITEANDAFLNLLGYSREDLLAGRIRWDKMTPPEFRKKDRFALEELITQGKTTPYEKAFLNKQGYPVPLIVGAAILEDQSRENVISFIIDLTQQKQAEKRLAIQYSVTRALAEATTLDEALPPVLESLCESLGWQWGLIWLMNQESNELYCRENWQATDSNLDQKTVEAFNQHKNFKLGEGLPGRVWKTGQPLWISSLQEDKNFLRSVIASQLGLKSALAFPILLENKVLGVIECFGDRTQEPNELLMQMMLGVGSQIGQFMERKRTESALRESQELFSSFMSHSPAWAYIKDEAGHYIYVNPPIERDYGRKLADWVGKTDFDLFPDSFAQEWRDNDLKVLKLNQTLQSLEKLPVELNRQYGMSFKFPFQDGSGRRFVAGMTIDVSDRIEMEQTLRESAERLSLALAASQMGDWSWDSTTDLVAFSTRAAEIFGIPSGPYMTWTQLRQRLHEADRDRAQYAVEHAIAQRGDYDIEYRVIRDNHQERWVSAKGQPYYNSNGQVLGMFGVVQDITERKHVEAEREALFALEQVARAEAEQAYKQAEFQRSRLQDFFMKAPALIAVTTGPDHVYEFANPTHVEIAGRQEEELLGKPFRVVYPELENQGFFEILDEVYQTGIPFIGNEMPVLYDRNHDGSLYQGYFNTVFQPLYNPDGQIDGLLLHGVEVTEQVLARQHTETLLKQLAAERFFLETVLQQMPGGVIIAEAPSGKLILGNSRVQEIWRQPLLPADEVDEYSQYQGFHANGVSYEPQEWPLARSISTGEVVTGEEIWFRRGDQTKGVMEVNSAPVRDQHGEIIAGVVTFEDISDRKRVEQEREDLLAREKAARAEAEVANRIKDEFLAVLSHELRSPLNPILGWSRLLRTRQFEPEARDRALETIERNAKLQTQLIEDLLDVSRILRGKMSLNVGPVNLATVVEAALETVRLAAETKGLEIHTQLDPDMGFVWGDSGRLQQIVWNLLSNAVKFTPTGGQIHVQLQQVNSQAQITVEDTGVGISSEFLPFVFDYFRQADSATTRRFGGLGLGLAIVRHLTELHGGTVGVESAGENQGTRFSICLPLRQTPVTEHQSPSLSHPLTDLKGLRILVVDDEVDMRELVQVILQSSGAEVEVVSSAVEALSQMQQSPPDVLISDIGMPDVDGYALLEQLRSQDAQNAGKIPAIALTAYAGEFDRKKALAVGFQKHIAKPVEPTTLVQAILSVVEEGNRELSTEGRG